MKTKLSRIFSMVLVICLCFTLLPIHTLQVDAARYYNETDLIHVKSSIISNSNRAGYVNNMMKYHILSSTENYKVACNLKDGKSVVFFFDGCSDNVDDPTYGDYTKYNISAYCAVVQEVGGTLKVVYESEYCSTIPDNPRNVTLNTGRDVPTVLDGVYKIKSKNHNKEYAALHIENDSRVAPAIRCNSTSSAIGSSNGINIHARSKFSGVAHNGIGPNTYSSTGCFNVGRTDDNWAEYNNFIYAVLGISNARNVKLNSEGEDKGIVIVDRSQYKSQLAKIYGSDNDHSAEGLVAKITAYTDNLNYEDHVHSYSGSYYEVAHPHKVYQKCSCGATKYTGATTTVNTCETCNPVSISGKYNAVLPFRAYLKGTSKVYPSATAQLVNASGGEIWSTDECTISEIYSNGACKVTYPAGSTTKTAYTSLSNFIGNTSASLTQQKVNRQVTTYIRANNGSTVYGHVSEGDTIYKLETSGGMTQIFYPTSNGYKLAWVVTSELTEPTYDNRFNPYCPIKGYPCATSDFNVYASDRTTVTGEIWTTDYCTINAVYADGWCQVSYPAGSTTKIGYVQLSKFVHDVSATHIKYTANTQTKVHKDKNLPGDKNWYIGSGDQFFVVGSYGSSSQVLYPIDAQYGGGYKLGWISSSNLPKTTYTVSYNANGGSGAPGNQTKTHGVALTLSSGIPTRSGHAFVGWATNANATSANYAPGSSYTTDANLTLYAVWTLNKYEVTYNANGGMNAPSIQNKAHGTNLTLSTAIPTKYYSVTYNANGGTIDATSKQVACEFLGWATQRQASAATYRPGGIFTENANTTLYAVWKDATLGSYPVPVRDGYVFDGWYTAASGGAQVTMATAVSNNMTIYAHWTVATYGVNYDANGGTGAPDSQIKTHGERLTLSKTVPTRSGYTFLGWATEESPEFVQYQPGSTYFVDNDIMLIAVWEQTVLSKIEVHSIPNKNVYYVGDMLNTTGLTLKATYSDGSTRIISDGFNCTPDSLSAVGTQTITVSYGDKTATFTVTIKERPVGAMSISNVSGKPGETVTVAIKLDSNPGIIAARLKIAYNSDALTLIEVKDGGILGDYVFGGDLSANPYIVTWENGLSTSDYTTAGTLTYLTFKILKSAPVGELPITVSYDPEEIYNKEQNNITFSITQGTITVEEIEEADPNAPQIIVKSCSAISGQPLTIEITAVNMPVVKSMMLENFLYDHDMLEFVSAKLNVENAFIADWDDSNMIATVAFEENTNINGVIMTLTFNVKEGIEGECSISCDIYANQSQTNGNETRVDVSVIPGVINVMSYARGDVNGDGYVTSVDSIYLLRHTILPSRYPINQSGDMNGDGRVNSSDAIYLLRHTLLPKRYPLY